MDNVRAVARLVSIGAILAIGGIFPPVSASALAQNSQNSSPPEYAGTGLTISFANALETFTADGATVAFAGGTSAGFAGAGITIAFQTAITMASGQGFT